MDKNPEKRGVSTDRKPKMLEVDNEIEGAKCKTFCLAARGMMDQ